ncbi:unnamed protein product [Vitrella brassicaformis CCMP3155]|uniref:ADP-ribosylation factor-like protein 6 n=1 Tax=Vitrella brassicaformis (strain CCMP3155) TaxID=1169540 RepID=A0A0G4EPB7_VITBC|nr:unnamed protein product [Vitrella brassicaformis CCMP3155]|eukprot:CEL99657.1 unnamed protein product [Vitrella brassicaformis CCMP3155]
MGIFKRLFGLFYKRRTKVKILAVGLDNSGKTTLLKKLRPKKADLSTVPTVGYEFESFSKNGVAFDCVDMSGQSKYRNLWEHYFTDTDGVIFVVDATDKLRFVVVREELETMLSHQEFSRRKIPLLFFANKMDLHDAVTPNELLATLQLDDLAHPWRIFASNALRGEGLEEGVGWLVDAIAEHKTTAK